MFTESLALSKRRLLNDGCHSAFLSRRSCDSINCGMLRRRTKTTVYLQIQYRKAVLASPNSRELACSCLRKGGDRSHRLAHLSAQPFLFATCVGCRSQGPAGVAASRGYSYDDEYRHARGSHRFERSKQQSGSFGAANAGSVSLMLP